MDAWAKGARAEEIIEIVYRIMQLVNALPDKPEVAGEVGPKLVPSWS